MPLVQQIDIAEWFDPEIKNWWAGPEHQHINANPSILIQAKLGELQRRHAEWDAEFERQAKAQLDAEAELANIISLEIIAEINREILRTLYALGK